MGGSPDGSGGGGGGGPAVSAVLRPVGRAVVGARRELVGGRSARVGEERAHLLEPRIDEMLGLVDAAPRCEPTSRREYRAAHDARRPDVAEHTTLVADPVGEPRLAEQLVEFRPVLVGDLVAHDLRMRLPRQSRRRFSRRRRRRGSRAAVRRDARSRAARKCRSRRATGCPTRSR